MSEKDILDGTIQRFAISALSKERKDEALNEEILVGKYTGEFFIKSKDGVVISTDILNRLKASMDSAIRYAEMSGLQGNVYKVDFDNLQLPCHVDYAVNIIEEEPIEIPRKSRKVLLNIDFDEFDIVNNTAIPVVLDTEVEIEIEIDGRNMTVIKTLKDINQTVIDLEITDTIETNIIIKSIELIRDDVVSNDEATDRTVIIHNIFISVGE